MSSLPHSVPATLIAAAPAANADQIGEPPQPPVSSSVQDSVSSGWDAYEVWRRFIKDARERRQQRD